MTDVLSRSLPSPRNWQDFERLTFDLYYHLWNSDDIELHGRAGQPQSGVDVYGTDYRSGDGALRFVGIQCKGKDAEYGKPVTEKELREEVAKAITFQPPLDLFILATTAPNDASLQAVARSITVDHRQSGKFAVQVKGWDTLRQFITNYPNVVAKHFQDLAPVDILGKLDEIRADSALTRQSVTLLVKRSSILETERGGDDSEDPLAKSVSAIADQISDGSPLAALKALERMLSEHGASASKLALFRMHANIGNAHLALGRDEAAIAAFVRGHETYPGYPNARATLALAKLLNGERDAPLILAKAALADDPTSRRAARLIIDLTPRGTPLADVEAALPVALREHVDIKLGLSIRANQDGDFSAALRFAEEAHQLKPADWRTISSVAEALLGPHASRDIVAMTGVLDKEMEADLDRAIELNREAWAILAKQDSSHQGRHVSANLVSQLLLTSDDASAWAVLEEALAHNPDYTPLLQREAQRCAGNGDWAAARSAIEKIPSGERIFEDAMLLMHCALNLKEKDAARALVPKLVHLATLPEQAEFAAALAVEASILDDASPNRAIESALKTYPQSVILRAILLESCEQDEINKRRLVDEIFTLAAFSISPRSRVLAAEAMMGAGEFSKAADLYEPLQGKRDSAVLFRRLQALHLAERRKEARRLYESLPASLRQKGRYAHLGIAIYEHAGLLKPAVKLLEDCLAKRDNLGDRLRWLQLLIRLGESRHMDWLHSVPADIEGSPRELAMLSQFVDKFLGGDAKALELGYRALRAGYGDAQVHLGYAFGLFFQGSSRRGHLAATSVVEPGAGVILIDDTSGEVLHYIIEPRDAPAAERGELAPDHPVAKDLLGCAVGEVITIRKIAPSNQTYRVAEIQNGYVFAFQRTLREFNRLFPGHPAFGSINLDESKEPEERFDQVFAMVRDRADQARSLEEFYESGPMPLFMLARFSGSSVFDIWEALGARPDKYLKVAIGIGQEFALGRSAADAGLVLVEPLVIYAWVRLGLAETMLRFRSRLGVVQSTIDMLRQLQAEREDQYGQTFGSMGWDGARYRMVEVSPEMIEQRIAHAGAAARFACQLVLVPAESGHPLSADIAGLLTNAHPSFVDTLFGWDAAQARSSHG